MSSSVAEHSATKWKGTIMNDTPNPIQVQKFLGGIDYPASKQDIVNAATQAGADAAVLDALNSLPDKNYDKPTDVSSAIGDLS